jgi:hypothetical protein
VRRRPQAASLPLETTAKGRCATPLEPFASTRGHAPFHIGEDRPNIEELVSKQQNQAEVSA